MIEFDVEGRPEVIVVATSTIVICSFAGANEGLITRSRTTQFCAACTLRLRTCGACPGCAAIVIGALL